MMNVAIIGAGLIGRKRAQNLPKSVNLYVVCDINKKKAEDFAHKFKCESGTDWKSVVNNHLIDVIIVSTPNKFLSKIAYSAVLKGKHVLIEKPGAKNLKELQKIIRAYNKKKVIIEFGYNHRYHPAIMKAKKIIDSKKYGEILFMRAKYGHGGRVGYEKEWRFNKDLSGGGECLDQGSHLIDLVNYFSGELKYHSGYINTLFWKTKLEDTSFLILKSKKTVANLSATCVEWKNLFSFEIMLKTAKIQIDGLGGSYGQEQLILYTMGPKMGPPNIRKYYFPKKDLSWQKENSQFFKRIKNKDYSIKALKDAEYVLKIIKEAYKKR